MVNVVVIILMGLLVALTVQTLLTAKTEKNVDGMLEDHPELLAMAPRDVLLALKPDMYRDNWKNILLAAWIFTGLAATLVTESDP
jgi:hypothetical protein